MTREEIISILSEEDSILEQLRSGPTALLLEEDGKDVPVQVKQVGDRIKVTTGKVFKHRFLISMDEIQP